MKKGTLPRVIFEESNQYSSWLLSDIILKSNYFSDDLPVNVYNKDCTYFFVTFQKKKKKEQTNKHTFKQNLWVREAALLKYADCIDL